MGKLNQSQGEMEPEGGESEDSDAKATRAKKRRHEREDMDRKEKVKGKSDDDEEVVPFKITADLVKRPNGNMSGDDSDSSNGGVRKQMASSFFNLGQLSFFALFLGFVVPSPLSASGHRRI